MASIDILLPYWGSLDLLKKTVDSVLSQSNKDWRLIVIDDCYPGDEAKKYFKTIKDRRVIYYKHEKNIGITNNFNYCIERAEAPFCILLGCDDILLPNFVDRALTHIGNADFYQPGVEVIDANGQVYLPAVDRVKRLLRPKKSRIYSGQSLATSLCRGNWLYFPSLVWRTKTLKKYRFDPTYSIVQDVILELSLIKDGAMLMLDNTITFQYRRFANSLSSKEKKKGGVRFNEEATVYNYFAEEFSSRGWQSAARAAKLRIISRIHELVS